jgi:hypothetical protein
MKRFRMSTLMLLVVIAALCVALLVRERRAARREAELQARVARAWPAYLREQARKEIANAFLEAATNNHLSTSSKKEWQAEPRK